MGKQRERSNVDVNWVRSDGLRSGGICVHGVACGACANCDASCVCRDCGDLLWIGSAQGDAIRIMRCAMFGVRLYDLQSVMSAIQSVMSMMQFVTDKIRTVCAKWVVGDTITRCWTENRVLSTSGSVRNCVSNHLFSSFYVGNYWELIFIDISSVIPIFPILVKILMKLLKFGATGHVISRRNLIGLFTNCREK